MFKAILCVIGTAGFCIILNVSKSKFLPAVLGGVVSAFTAALLENNGAGLFKTILVSMIALCAYSEIAARLLKAPVSVIMIPGSIPLLPGGSLYYMMRYLVHFDSRMSSLFFDFFNYFFTRFSRTPIPSISQRTRSPSARYLGGSKPMPTPAGVPIAMIVPALSVIPWDSSEMTSATPKII